MKLLLYQSLMLLSWYKYISCDDECGPRINVSGAEGGQVTLPVKLQEGIKDVTWIRSNNHFATTKPNGQITIRVGQFRGRLRSETDASLTLTDLTNQDQGIYSAAVLYKSDSHCKQVYDLQVYRNLSSEDILIHPNVIKNGPCNVTVTLSCAVIGSDVTVTWNNTNSPGTEVTNHTLHVYNAHTDIIYSCTARNPISEASRTAHIPVTCPTDNTNTRIQGHTTLNTWLIVLGVLAVGAAVVAVYYLVNQRKKRDQHNLELKGQTIYAQVQKPKRGTVSVSGTREGTADNSASVYSEVQLPKAKQQNINGKKDAVEKPMQEKKADTVYSEVTHPVQVNAAGIRNENPYVEGQTVESCYDSVQNMQAGDNTMDPLSNKPRRTSYDQVM